MLNIHQWALVTFKWISLKMLDDNKSLLEAVLTCHQKCSVAFTWEQFGKKCSWTLSVTCVRRLQFLEFISTSCMCQLVISQIPRHLARSRPPFEIMVSVWSTRTYTRPLTHWGRVTYICASKLTFIGSDSGLSPDRRQSVIWPNARILLIGLLGTNFSEILIVIHTSSFNKMHLKMSSGKWRPFSSA